MAIHLVLGMLFWQSEIWDLVPEPTLETLRTGASGLKELGFLLPRSFWDRGGLLGRWWALKCLGPERFLESLLRGVGKNPG